MRLFINVNVYTMKLLLIFILGLLMYSCDGYDEYFDDMKILPIGTKSLLATKPVEEIRDAFISYGYSVDDNDNGYETSVFKIDDIGYFKCEMKGIGHNTQIKVLYKKTKEDTLKYLKYTNDSTFIIFHRVIDILEVYNFDGSLEIYCPEQN